MLYKCFVFTGYLASRMSTSWTWSNQSKFIMTDEVIIYYIYLFLAIISSTATHNSTGCCLFKKHYSLSKQLDTQVKCHDFVLFISSSANLAFKYFTCQITRLVLLVVISSRAVIYLCRLELAGRLFLCCWFGLVCNNIHHSVCQRATDSVIDVLQKAHLPYSKTWLRESSRSQALL